MGLKNLLTGGETKQDETKAKAAAKPEETKAKEPAKKRQSRPRQTKAQRAKKICSAVEPSLTGIGVEKKQAILTAIEDAATRL